MADLGHVAAAAAKLVDALEDGIEEEYAEIGAIMLLAEVTYKDEDGDTISYCQWHSSDGRFLVQAGMVAWAHAGVFRGAERWPRPEAD